jgi:hypothetical protein
MSTVIKQVLDNNKNCRMETKENDVTYFNHIAQSWIDEILKGLDKWLGHLPTL